MTPERRAATILTVAYLLASADPLRSQRGPAPTWTNLPAEVLSLACAPVAASETTQAARPVDALRLAGGQDSIARRIYAPGDLVTINAGTLKGIEVGQEFFVRRSLSDRRASVAAPLTLRTAGWIRVYAVDDTMSLATITHACDSIEAGDYLEPFALPVVPTPAGDRPAPERGNYGRVMTGSDGRISFGKGDFFLVDRGSEDGVTPGMHFVMYRDTKTAGAFLYDLGEAVAMAIGPRSSTLLVTVSRDAIQEGDYVAMRREVSP